MNGIVKRAYCLTIGARRFSSLVVSVCLLCALLIPVRSTAFNLNGEEKSIEKYAVKRVQPSYPPNAQKFKIEGTVTVQVTVGEDGKVVKAEFIRGQNVFRSVALDAAKRWEFKLQNQESNQGVIQFTFKFGG